MIGSKKAGFVRLESNISFMGSILLLMTTVAIVPGKDCSSRDTASQDKYLNTQIAGRLSNCHYDAHTAKEWSCIMSCSFMCITAVCVKSVCHSTQVFATFVANFALKYTIIFCVSKISV